MAVIGPNAIVAHMEVMGGWVAAEITVEPLGSGHRAKPNDQIRCAPGCFAPLQITFIATHHQTTVNRHAEAHAGERIGYQPIAAHFR